MAQFSWQVSPAFGKFMLCHSLLWKTYISTWGFLLLRKKAKSERVQLVLHWAVTEAVCTPAARSGPTKFLPQEPHSASQHQATRALNCFFEHLCFIVTSFVLLLARCVLRYQKRLRELCKSVTLSIKLDIIKNFDHSEWDRRCSCTEFWVWELSSIFSI